MGHRASRPFGPERLSKNASELIKTLNKLGIAVYPLRSGLPCFSPILKTERRPTLGNLNAMTRSVAEKLNYSPDQLKQALDACL